MSFEEMIARCLDGLAIIQTRVPSARLGAHTSMLFLPAAKSSNFTNSQAEELKDLGWVLDPNFGAMFPTVG